MNQRGAPELYLEVVPVTEVEKQYQLGMGQPIEYALKMCQFPRGAVYHDV